MARGRRGYMGPNSFPTPLAPDTGEVARLIVNESNVNELFQNFIRHTQDIDASKAKKDANEVLPVNREKAMNDEK
ncbi:hypothetical protein JAAARDRAFT_198809 [Jaapia argillacea MUCL 33604]|uniref:HAM1-like N-terminal domain-containing protein n=1 Tax=Jaapia argillacea MUCL 33604 TaxID=933084 RepID=A0A067PN24_9AGAM|nr:hypothetical protein JAAARDRAFT_198809 [Jaapia argillacea MUCL 33604]